MDMLKSNGSQFSIGVDTQPVVRPSAKGIEIEFCGSQNVVVPPRDQEKKQNKKRTRVEMVQDFNIED
jgi:hypothetical protein